jgi:hypothetical protein
MLSEPLTWLMVMALYLFFQTTCFMGLLEPPLCYLGALLLAGGGVIVIRLFAVRCPSCGCWIRGTTLQRWEQGCCLRCGYDLTGNTSGRCPECGEPA